MTPGARIAAAIEILDHVLEGAPAEQALTGWARRSRFAGSKDRAAVRDHVYDAVRNLRSFAVLGGGSGAAPTGRAVMIGALRASGADPSALFDGAGHAPPPLTDAETDPGIPEPNDRMNLPDWLCDLFRADLGKDAAGQAALLGQRAPVTIRANTARIETAALQARLAEDGIAAEPNPLSPAALTVTDGARGLTRHASYLEGHFEMQDAASQAVVSALPVNRGASVLDFCAGGGGKSLALAALGAKVTAHDAASNRMAPISERAARAGVPIRVETDRDRLTGAGYDLVLADAPCSGSGAWRRAPDAKWRLTPERLSALVTLQGEVLLQAAAHVRPGGWLAYATCSILCTENKDQAASFAAQSGWEVAKQRQWPISAEGDGFFLALFRRTEA